MAKKIISLGLLAALLLYGNLSMARPLVLIKQDLPTKPVMKSPARHVVTLYDNMMGSLELLSRANLGSAAVEVVGEVGMAYYSTWQAAAGELHSIPFEDWELGAYTLTVTASSGAVYTWDFELVE